MKKIVLLFILLPFFSFSQQVQWVAKVLKSSSDLGGKQYSSRRVAGKPDAFPQVGDSPNAWAPKNAQDGHDFIEVEYEKSQTVKQIAIFENLNTGCLVKVMVSNGDGKYREVFRNKLKIEYWKNKSKEYNRNYYFSRKRRKVVDAPDVNYNAGIEYAILDQPEENVKSLRVVFNFKKSEGEKQIDAIGISDSETPVIAEINTTKEFDALSKPESIFSSEDNFSVTAICNEKIYLNIDDKDGNSKIFTLDIGANKAIELPASINKNSTYNYLARIENNRFILGGVPYQQGTKQSGFEFYHNNGTDFIKDKPLEIVAFNNFDPSATISPNKEASVLVMGLASDICLGGLDLYFTKIKEDGSYSFLQNLSKNVNSADDEYAPFLCADEETLLFTSAGFSGYGSLDLFYTKRLDDTWKKWSDPINLGSVINSYTAQSSVVYDDKNEMLYFTSYANDAYQLYKIKVPKSLFVAR